MKDPRDPFVLAAVALLGCGVAYCIIWLVLWGIAICVMSPL